MKAAGLIVWNIHVVSDVWRSLLVLRPFLKIRWWFALMSRPWGGVIKWLPETQLFFLLVKELKSFLFKTINLILKYNIVLIFRYMYMEHSCHQKLAENWVSPVTCSAVLATFSGSSIWISWIRSAGSAAKKKLSWKPERWVLD